VPDPVPDPQSPSPERDPERHFASDHLRQDLAGRSVRSGSFVVLSQVLTFVLGALSMMVLARLLEPADFGLLIMAGTLNAFVFSFREFGFGMTTIQHPGTNHARATHLFWLNLKLNLLVTVFMFAMAPLLAWFYGERPLVAIIPLLACAIYVNSSMNIHRAILRRQMRFGELAMVDLVSQVIGIVVAVTGALLGMGFWALAAQQVTLFIIEAVGFAWLSGWKPGRHSERAGRADKGVGEMLTFSRSYTRSRIIDYLSNNFDQILVGRMSGAEALGLYGKAFQWSIQPLRQVYLPLHHVVVAGASRLLSEPDKYRAYMRKGLLTTFVLVLPVQAFLFAAGRDFILVLLGEKWEDAIPIFRLLVLGGFVATAGHLTRWVYVAEARTREQLQWASVSAPLRLLAVAIGVYWGAIGVASGIAISAVVLTVPNVIHCLRRSPLTHGDFWGGAVRPAVLSILSAAAVLVFDDLWLQTQHILVRCALSAAMFGAVYLAGLFITPGGRRDTATLLGIVGALRRK
jgi:O-antigen/teichoic acid export membrane protein